MREQYGEASGVDIDDLRFEMVYNAVRHASIMSRCYRSVRIKDGDVIGDPDDAFRFKELLEEMIAD